MSSQDSPATSQPPIQATIPTVSFAHQRSAAEERKKSYPFRFPRDTRQLGGAFSVARNSKRLVRFFYF